MRAWGAETPPHKANKSVMQESRGKELQAGRRRCTNSLGQKNAAWRGSPRYACKADVVPEQEPQAAPVRRRSSSKSEEEVAGGRGRRKSAGDAGVFPIHEDAPVQGRVLKNRAFVAAIEKCVPGSNSLPLIERAGEERLQKIQQEVEAAEEEKEALMEEILDLREQRAAEQQALDLCRQQRGQMQEKLDRCREVVTLTVDSMDNFYDHKAEVEDHFAKQEEMAEEEEICADLMKRFQAAQARVVAAGVAAIELSTTVSDESFEEQDSSPDIMNALEENSSWSYAGTGNTQENFMQPYHGKKLLEGKLERSPFRSPLCELNTIN